MEAAPHPWPALGVLLLRDGLVEKHELEEILAEQRDSRQQRVSGRRLGEVLIQRGRVTPTQVAKLVAEQYEIPFLDFDVADIDVRVATILSEDDARRLSALPISRNGDGTFLLAIADPATVLFSDELRRLLDSVPRFAVVGPDAIERAITFVFSQPHPTFTIAAEPPLFEAADDLIVTPSDDVAPPAEAEPWHDDTPVPAQSWPPLGALLLRDGLITDGDLEAALAQQRLAPSLRLGEILTGKGLVTRAAVSRLVAEQYELPFYELDRVEIDPAIARRLPEEIAWRLKAVPIAEHEDGSVQVAIADPTAAVYSDELHLALAVPLAFVVASPDDIEATLDRVHEPASEPHTEQSADPETESEPFDLDSSDDESLELTEPTHLVVEAGTPETVAPPPEDDESSWTTRLELVDETVSDEIPEHAEHDVTELSWGPFPEIVYPEVVDETPVSDEAEVIELRSERPETEDAPELESASEVEDAEVYEFSWPAEPADRDEHSLVDELSMQVAEAMVADVLELTTADEREDALVAGTVAYDIFGIGSQPVAEPSTGTEDEFIDEPVEDTIPFEDVSHALADDDPVATDETSLTPWLVVDPEPEEQADAEVAAEAEFESTIESETETEAEFRAETEVELEAEATVETEVEFDAATEVVTEVELDAETETVFETDDEHATEATVSDFDAAVAGALAAGATAIHFSPRGESLSARARVDGLMRDLGTATPEDRDAVVQRLESEGVARTHVVATSRGPKTTLFIRERAGSPTSLGELGLPADAVDALEAALRRQTGAVLVCGPAGSGTTTTLYALLDALASPERVVATVEHPVERVLEGIDQIEVDPSGGVTFAAALRELRLTDTDAVLVGDLPDRESALGALSSAHEGRFVVAGFRARSAATAVLRLADMGVEPAALASSLACVVSQRLVRAVCAECRETYYASDEELAMLDQSDTGNPRLLARGAGCQHCAGTGFRGRTAIFEVMPVTEDLRGLIADGASAKKLQKAAVAAGMRTLRDEGVRLCLDGLTTVDEVVRVLGDDT